MPPQNQYPGNQPPSSQPPVQSGQYDFMFQPPAKRSPFSFGGSKGLIVMIGGGLVVIIVLYVLYSLFFGGKPDVTNELVDIAAKQQEIIRLDTAAAAKARDPNVTAIIATSRSVVTSDQSQILQYLKTFRVKPNTKDLAAHLSKKTDEQLAGAEQNGRFEDEYITVLANHLRDYQNSIKTTFNLSESAKTKALLQTAFNNSQAVLGWDRMTATATPN